ncbi:MAG: hypothetical protein IKC79_03535 [Clostridia bacterium]|nr:hypothetical protein [Clostridia bacterium]
MEWYWILSIVLGSIVVLTLIPFWIQMRLYVNIEYNIAAVSISVFGVSVVCFQAELNELGIKIMRNKGKDKEIKFSAIDESAIMLQQMLHKSMRMISVQKLELYYDVGKQGDAYKTSMYGGVVNTITNIMIAWLYTKRGIFPAYIGIDENTKEDKMAVSMYLSVVVMPIVIILAFVLAKIKTKKVVALYARRKVKNKNR